MSSGSRLTPSLTSCSRRGERTEFLAVRPCKADAYEVVPKRRVKLDIDECEQMLAANGYDIVSNRGVMLVFRKGVEMTLYPHGRVLMHPVSSKEEASRIAEELYVALRM